MAPSQRTHAGPWRAWRGHRGAEHLHTLKAALDHFVSPVLVIPVHARGREQLDSAECILPPEAGLLAPEGRLAIGENGCQEDSEAGKPSSIALYAY
jgi:hypothetical protein